MVDYVAGLGKATDKAMTREDLAKLIQSDEFEVADDGHEHHDHDHDHSGHDHDHAGHDHDH